MSTIQYNLKIALLLPSFLGLFSTAVQADSAKLVNPANNHSYQRFDKAKTWIDAKNACTTLGGYLVTITSQAEQDWITSTIAKYTLVWIGASGNLSTGQWQWVTGETWSYTDWKSGLLSSSGVNYALLSNIHDPSGVGWVNTPSNPANAYICEWDRPLNTYTSMITADTNNDGSPEFIFISNNGATLKVASYDIATGEAVSDVSFMPYPTYNAVTVSVLEDMNANGYKELTLLMTKKSDGSSVVQIRDSKTGKLIKSYNPPR